MFANNSGLIGPYTELVSVLIQRVKCREIGLKIQLGAFEYPLWQIARHAGEDLVFRHVKVDNESARIENGFSPQLPCAVTVIASGGDWDPDLSGLEKMQMIWSRPPIRLLVLAPAG